MEETRQVGTAPLFIIRYNYDFRRFRYALQSLLQISNNIHFICGTKIRIRIIVTTSNVDDEAIS